MNLNISSNIIGKDFYTDLTRTESLHTKELNSVCNSLIPWLKCIPNSINFTYESMVGGSQSLIDHFIFSNRLVEFVSSVDVIHDGNNVSDHSIISIVVDISVSHFQNSQFAKDVNEYITHREKSTNEHIDKYKVSLDKKLKCLYN